MRIKVCSTAAEIGEVVRHYKKEGKSVGFVPTMGALHNGHISLITEAQKHADIVICSIFVNPTQFNEKTDLEKYPRTLQADVELLENANCDYVYAPTPEDVYKDEKTYEFDFKGLNEVMEGPNRPGHFEGVVQVVKRLFEIVSPDYACFGLKDFQQFAILRHMTNYFGFETKIIGCPIIREENGLAMSSRNRRLSEEDITKSLVLNRVLHFVKDNYQTLSVDDINNLARNWLSVHSELEYFSIHDSITLRPISKWEESNNPRAFIATWVGDVRLIDNMEVFNDQNRN